MCIRRVCPGGFGTVTTPPPESSYDWSVKSSGEISWEVRSLWRIASESPATCHCVRRERERRRMDVEEEREGERRKHGERKKWREERKRGVYEWEEGGGM